MLRPPLVDGVYPVTALIEALGVHAMASVVAAPVAVTVTTVAQAVEAIALVPRVAVPLAIVVVQVVQVMLPVDVVIANGAVAVIAGVPVPLPQVTVAVPATEGTVCVIVPDVNPDRAMTPLPVPVLTSWPVALTFHPTPLASACHGIAAELAAV